MGTLFSQSVRKKYFPGVFEAGFGELIESFKSEFE